MPSLKDLHCFIELAGPKRNLQEFRTIYGDGFVETFVAVPSDPHPFAVHLTSGSFIAPGLAMYVFIDGVYQCNRNRQDLKLRNPPDYRAVVDFCVRKKEEKQKDGTMIARDWKFEKLNISSANYAPNICSPNILDNIGCIEVVVLRCAGPRNAKTTSTKRKPEPFNFDGASDYPDYYFGLDGQASEWGRPVRGPGYDDRDWSELRGRKYPSQPVSSYHGPPPPLYPAPTQYGLPPPLEPAPSQSTLPPPPLRPDPNTYGHHPPPPLQPYAGTIYSYDGAMADRRRAASANRDMSPAGFSRTYPNLEGAYQYGTGPIPHRSKAQSAGDLPIHVLNSGARSTNLVDQSWLDDLVAKAVKRGVEQSQNKGATPQANGGQALDMPIPGHPYQPPGALHSSPYGPFPPMTKQSDTWQKDPWAIGGSSTALSDLAVDYWARKNAPTMANSRVNWSQAAGSAAPPSGFTANGWGSSEEDSWTTDDTWDTNNADNGWGSSGDAYSHAKPGSGWDISGLSSEHPRVNPRRVSQRRRSSNHHDTRSQWQEPAWESDLKSAADIGGWTHVNATSSSDRSSAWTKPESTIRPSSSISAVPPTPPTIKTYKTRSRRHPERSRRSVTTVPPPTWAASASHKTRRHSEAATFRPPSPYGTTLEDLMQRTTVEDHEKRRRSSRRKDIKTTKGDWDASRSWTATKAAKNQEKGWGSEATGWTDSGNSSRAEAIATGWKTSRPELEGFGHWNDSNNWDHQDDAKKSNTSGWNSPPSAITPSSNPWDAPAPPTVTDRNPSKVSKAADSSHKHKLRSPPIDTGPKPHWQFPPEPSKGKKLYPVPDEEPVKVDKETADKKGVKHQVIAGKGTPYGHAVGRPEYLDSLDKPYAVFRFKYRSRSFLKTLFGDEVPDKEPTSSTKPTVLDEIKEKLKGVPQEELVDHLLKLQSKIRDNERKRLANDKGTEAVVMDRTKDWVRQHSRETSEKGKTDAKKKSEKKAKSKNDGKRKDGRGHEKKGGAADWGQDDKEDDSMDGGWGGNDGWGGGAEVAKGNW